MGPLQLLSCACVAFTLGMFGTGLSDLQRMYTARSVENIQFLPFLTTDINNLSWLSYGFLKGDWTLIIVNAIGATLQTLYVLVYFYFSPEKRSVLLKTLALLAVLLLGYCYFNMLVQDVTLRLARLGLFCSLFTISMYLSPLADLAKIVKTQSTQCLSFPLTVTTFLASASWTLYGLLLQDLYIAVPNVPGIATSMVRFWLFWRFPDHDRAYKLLQA
ncbi:sugar transporter SWEET1 isoform X3 [Hemicordylus capensis]|uniref:sugar transporter SWEET1 isoform X3 n=1 Tax=Hemicordylus capensis TaxID=884348 RepID=UPI002302E0E2|nr:sugar transporter SWEET1 isoform X3 [Hemicordylus capensis]